MSLLDKPAGTRTNEECWEIALENEGLLLDNFREFAALSGTSTTLDYDDLRQEGLTFLFRAAKKFDPTKGFQFSTLAMWYLKTQFKTLGFNDRKPAGGSRNKHRDENGKSRWNERVAYVNSLEEMAEHYYEEQDGENVAALPVIAGGEDESAYWADVTTLREVIDDIREEFNEEDRAILNAKMTDGNLSAVGRQFDRSRAWADYRWRYIIEPKVRSLLQDMEYYLEEEEA